MTETSGQPADPSQTNIIEEPNRCPSLAPAKSGGFRCEIPAGHQASGAALYHRAEGSLPWRYALDPPVSPKAQDSCSVTLNSIGWAMAVALGDVAPDGTSHDGDVRSLTDRMIQRLKGAEEALLELAPLKPDVVTIPLADVAWQWGVLRDPDVAVVPIGESGARFNGALHDAPVVRRVVGPWEEAPASEAIPEPALVYLVAVCDVAGGVPIRTTAGAAPEGVYTSVVGAAVILPCSWDGRHQHTYTVVTREDYEAREVAQHG